MYSKSTLPLLYLASPTLPIGAFAYSQGLESAIELGWVTDADSLQEWLEGVLLNGMGKLDIPVLFRLRQAWKQQNSTLLSHWNNYLRANRETSELLFEDEQLGGALKRLLLSLVDDGSVEKVNTTLLPAQPGFVCMYAITASGLAVNENDAALGFCWSWLENQVAVACKTIPLGQTKAQTVLLTLMKQIEPVVERAKTLKDSELGATLPGLAIASAKHETQYSRLFRS